MNDAPLKAETLVALSIPHAANTAHDGAIVVEDFRITRAGVILPLSAQTLDPRFGTRHRGAIGVSEETDGFVLIISEERGELRIAHRGTISDALEPAELQERVETWLSTPRNDPTASASSSTLTAGAVLESVGHSAIMPKPTGDDATSSRSQTHMSKAAMEES